MIGLFKHLGRSARVRHLCLVSIQYLVYFCNHQAAIVNYYPIGTTLAGHTDHSEINLEAPLFSFSFGQTAIFLLGGKTKEQKPAAMFLKRNMSAKSRPKQTDISTLDYIYIYHIYGLYCRCDNFSVLIRNYECNYKHNYKRLFVLYKQCKLFIIQYNIHKIRRCDT